MNKEEIENLSDFFDEEKRKKYYSKKRTFLFFLNKAHWYIIDLK